MHHRVFVYGTLLRGQVNHHLLAGAVRLGTHRTAPVFTLIQPWGPILGWCAEGPPRSPGRSTGSAGRPCAASMGWTIKG
jgi:hypothetical protein